MSHNRRAHTRRYPLRDGYRKPGRVHVRGAHVSESSSSGDDGCCCCMLILIGLGLLVFAGIKVSNWAIDIFEAIMN